MDLLKIVGIALIGAVSALILRQNRPELGMLVSLACGILIISMGLDAVQSSFAAVESLLQKGGIEDEYAEILFKALGICVITQIAADVCKDSGEGAIASKVEFLGKISVLMVSMPLFYQVFSTAVLLLNF